MTWLRAVLAIPFIAVAVFFGGIGFFAALIASAFVAMAHGIGGGE